MASDRQTSPSVTATAAFDSSIEESDASEDNGWERLQESLKHSDQAPSKLGRFVIIGRLGQGGMGVVYSAYDPQLDRRVALKLVRASGSRRARDRLLREAQALARLSHPNVVPVHDVGVIDNNVFVVMEFVDGQTLRRWVEAEPRSWREILAVYRQAGEGLSAAHEVDLVHRDFKPDNAVIGEDGRVRVLDFGLAHRRPGGIEQTDESLDGSGETESANGHRSPPNSAAAEAAIAFESTLEPSEAEISPAQGALSNQLLGAPLTRTGAILGTPAYMPPEQLLGTPAGQAADQFSFCVSLFEALFGQRPFAGSDLAELTVSVLAGTVRELPRQRDVPPWLAEAVTRGLRPEPVDRHPSMRDLLTALDRDPARTWRRRLLAAAALALVALAIFALTRPPPPAVEPCTDSWDELAGVWNDERRHFVDQALRGTGLPYAEEAAPLVLAGLDRYAESWAGMHREACMAHQRGHQSGALLDKRMTCLAGRRSALASTVEVLGETEPDGLTSTVDVVHKLPSIAYCANTEALEAEIPPPEDPDDAQTLAGLRERLRTAQVRNHAGSYKKALDLSTALIVEANELGYRPFLAEVTLLQGHAYWNLNKHEDASKTLHHAMVLGLETGMTAIAVEALARRIKVDGSDSDANRNAELHAYVAIAEPLTKRLPDRTFVLGLLLNNIGTMYYANDDRDMARKYLQRAYEVKQSAPDPDAVELSESLFNLGLATHDEHERALLLERAATTSEKALGRAHPSTLVRRRGYGQFVTDPRHALEIIEPVCKQRKRLHPNQRVQLAVCQYYVSLLYSELGLNARAAALFSEVARIDVLFTSSDMEDIGIDLARGYALLYQEVHQRALSIFEELVSKRDIVGQPSWHEFWIAQAHLGIGLSQLQQSEFKIAVKAFETALAKFTQVATLHRLAMVSRLKARAQVGLSRALLGDRPDDLAVRARAATLLATAISWYRKAGTSYQDRVSELERWRRELL